MLQRSRNASLAPCAGQTTSDPAADAKTTAGSTKQYLEWQPGQLHKVTSGGSEVQSLLDRLKVDEGIAVVVWFAGWAESCRASIPALERCHHPLHPLPCVVHAQMCLAQKALACPPKLAPACRTVLRAGKDVPVLSSGVETSYEDCRLARCMQASSRARGCPIPAAGCGGVCHKQGAGHGEGSD